VIPVKTPPSCDEVEMTIPFGALSASCFAGAVVLSSMSHPMEAAADVPETITGSKCNGFPGKAN